MSRFILLFAMLLGFSCAPPTGELREASISSRTKRVVWVAIKKWGSQNYRRPAIVSD